MIDKLQHGENMTKGLFGIGMPSNRPWERSGPAIESVINYCRKTGTDFSLSDNSDSAGKEASARPLLEDAGLTYLKTPACGMIQNWLTAFESTDAEFVLIMGDDDRIFSYGTRPDFSSLPDDVACVRPALMAYTNEGIQRVNISPINAPNGPGRIAQNLEVGAGNNMAIYSFWRRSVFKSISDLWFRHHPTRGTYCDWSAMHALISSGKAVLDPSTCFFYDMNNWAGDAGHISAQVERAFTTSGLPAGSSLYHGLLSAVDSFIFTYRKDSPLAAQDRLLSAVHVFNLYFKGYVENVPQGGTHEKAMEIKTLSSKLAGLDSLPEIFGRIAPVLDAIRPDLGAEYKAFYERAIGKRWGEI